MSDSTKDTTYTVHVPEDKAGSRLDKVLAETLADLSRSRIEALLAEGRVRGADGAVQAKPSRKVRAGETFVVAVPPARPAEPEAQAMALDIHYEDEWLIVLDKPPGLVVHPAPGSPDHTLVNALIAHCGDGLSGIGGVARPGIVHRIDKDTSGLMVVAKNDAAHQALSAQFAAHDLERAYKALVWGLPAPFEGEITGNIGRNPRNRKKMAVVRRGGKEALTRYRVLDTYGAKASLVECRLATGRTHQIRVHMAATGHPLVGDPVYGGGDSKRAKAFPEPLKTALSGFERQALHAYLIGFLHPKTGKLMCFESNLPNDLNELLCRFELLKI